MSVSAVIDACDCPEEGVRREEAQGIQHPEMYYMRRKGRRSPKIRENTTEHDAMRPRAYNGRRKWSEGTDAAESCVAGFPGRGV